MNIIYSKDNCPYCDQAKALLNTNNIDFIEMKIGEDLRREEFIELFPNQKTVPLIILDGTVIGGYKELAQHLNLPDLQEKTINREAFDKLLKNNIVTVTFVKVDGSTRIMQATLDPKFLPGDMSVLTSGRDEALNLIHVYDIEANGWRTIKLPSIISYNVKIKV